MKRPSSVVSGGLVAPVAVALVSVVACDRFHTEPVVHPLDAAAVPSADASGAPGAVNATGHLGPTGPETWRGTFSLTEAGYYVPDGGEWAGTRSRGLDGSAGLGEGELALEVAPRGAVSGTAKGALGACVAFGVREGSSMSFTLRCEGDDAWVGTARADRTGDKWTGAGRASSAGAHYIRAIAFTLSKGP